MSLAARTLQPSPPLRPATTWLRHWTPIWGHYARAGLTIGLLIGHLLLLTGR